MKSKIIVNIKKLISALIFTILISSALPPNLLNYVVIAANKNVSIFDELKNAVNNANDGDVIILTSNITIPNSATATEENYHCVLNCSKNITIKSASGQRYTIYHQSSDGLLAMTNGCTVNLENITIDFGKNNDIDIYKTLIRLYSSSTLNIKSGTTIQNGYILNKNTIQNGYILNRKKIQSDYVQNRSAIFCEDNSNINIDQTSTIINLHTSDVGIIYLENSSLNLNGTISNCSANNGRAIYSSQDSTLILNGTISNCNANDGGAIYSYKNSKIKFNGIISDCSANDGGAIYLFMSNSLTFNGTISNCIATNNGSAYL